MRKREIRPLYDRVLVRRVKEEPVRVGGIEIPDIAKEKPQEGVVVAVGQGRLVESGDLIPCTLEMGDRVMFAKYSGTEIPTAGGGDGEEYLMMREDEVMAIVFFAEDESEEQ